MKVCEMCGAQNDDVFTKCAICGADLPSFNSEVGDDEKTVLIDSDEQNQSGFSLKTDTNTYGQPDAGQANPQPAQFGMPGQGMPQNGMAGMPGQGMPQNGMAGMSGQGMPQNGMAGMPGQGMPQNGMPGQPPYGMPGQPGFGAPAQQPKKKTGLIIGILAVAVIAVAAVLFFILKGGAGAKGGVDSAEAVAKQFIEAMDEQDVDKIAKLCPPFLDPSKDDLQDMIDSYSGYDVTFTYEGIESQDDYDSDDLADLQDDVSDYSGRKIQLQDACDLEFSFNVSVEMDGEKYDQSSTYTITCIKYKGNWYLYE